MAICITSRSWPACQYRVRYAESRESIYQKAGWRKHRHRLWALDVGPIQAAVRVKGRIVLRDKDSVALYAPGIIYEENMEVGRLISWAWLLIEEKGKPSLLKQLTGDSGFCILLDPAQFIRTKIVELASIARQSSAGGSFLVTACLHQVLGHLFMLHQKAGKESTSGKKNSSSWVHPWRSKVWAALENSHSGDLTMKQFADEIGVSSSTITHQYRKVCGESFQDTVNNWRVEKACALLARKDLSIKEVANSIGFSHQSYLSTFFKTVTGCSPTAYRKLKGVRGNVE
ncbi:MAG: AraC family transcriptional regulator [Chthoniobacterales bacterium]